ncbi:MAG: lactate utilization protein [Candidatus Lernaella stagnicola]|nr:lactate utilization protein [Candidatus Lernaella stagnicola]
MNVAARSFKENGFQTLIFKKAADVRAAFAERLAKVDSVGFGGSATLRELELDVVAEDADVHFHNHWRPGLSSEEEWQERLAQGRADLFLTSANAATIDGQLVIVDGVGNRLAAAVFGPREVIFVLGENKIVRNLDAALQRVKRVAAPQRARQLDASTPCTSDGRCHDCRAPSRICRSTLIIERPSFGMRVDVWLVRANLGL